MKLLPIPLYIPNILGYIRIILSFVALWKSSTNPIQAVVLWILSAFLDLIDGIVARKLNQCSSLGIFVSTYVVLYMYSFIFKAGLDVAADNILRTSIWVAVVKSYKSSSNIMDLISTFIICIEWLTFLSTQIHSLEDNGNHWKIERENDLLLVKYYFHNNFRNPLGCIGIYGLFMSGILTYCSMYSILYENIPFFLLWLYVAYIGRVISLTIEIWFCYRFLRMIVLKDSKREV